MAPTHQRYHIEHAFYPLNRLIYCNFLRHLHINLLLDSICLPACPAYLVYRLVWPKIQDTNIDLGSKQQVLYVYKNMQIEKK